MDKIEEAVLAGHNVLILGAAGTGKSVLIRRLSDKLGANKSVAITASTGIAACNIKGVTIHKFMGIMDGRFQNEEIASKILNDEKFYKTKEQIKKIDCIIIDEISMLSSKTFQQIEHVLRKVRGIHIPFGGVQMILSGDFYQLKPVANLRYQDPGDMVIAAENFKDLIAHHFVLTEVYRQKEGIQIYT